LRQKLARAARGVEMIVHLTGGQVGASDEREMAVPPMDRVGDGQKLVQAAGRTKWHPVLSVSTKTDLAYFTQGRGRVAPSRGRDFEVFWIGQSVSLIGSQITTLALPLAAVLTLGAGAAEMGVLQAARFLPFLLLTLPMGVYVDRLRRRPVLLAANLGRAAALALIPVAAFLGVLRMELLYAVAFGAGALSALFDVASIAVPPWLVPPAQLVRANARVVASQSFAEAAGPALAGQLVQLLTAPGAILLDALSFLVGAGTVALIRAPEPRSAEDQPRGTTLDEVRAGLGAVFRNPYVRAIGLMAATYNLIETGILALLVLYATNDVGFQPAALGLVLGTGAVGALVGSVFAEPLGRRLGIGAATGSAMLIETVAFLPLAFLPDASPLSGLLLAAALFANGWGLSVSNVHSISVRQHVTPTAVLGRMNASYRFLVTGTVPVGALIAGVLGEAIGLRATLLMLAAVLPLSLLWILFSPLPRLRTLAEASP
jgi:MFS family permease